MKCLHPIKLSINRENPKAGFFYAPCGKCVACQQNKARDLAFRLDMQRNDSLSCFFLTLTYDNEHLPLVEHHEYDENGEILSSKFIPNVDKNISVIFKNARSKIQSDIRKKYPLKRIGNMKKASLERIKLEIFNENQKRRRLKAYAKNKFVNFKYYLISEYGPHNTRRSHYHAIIYFSHKIDILAVEKFIKDYIWNKGIFTIDYVNNARINYLAQYMKKECPNYSEFQQKNITRCSRGIGSNFLKSQTIKNYVHQGSTDRLKKISWRGYSIELPKFYKEKLKNLGLVNRYTEEELKDLSNLQLEQLTETFGLAYKTFLDANKLTEEEPFQYWKEFQLFQYEQEHYLKNNSNGFNRRKNL